MFHPGKTELFQRTHGTRGEHSVSAPPTAWATEHIGDLAHDLWIQPHCWWVREMPRGQGGLLGQVC